MPLDHWIEAERKWVKEGSNPYYWSGFHIYTSIESVKNWTHRAHQIAGRCCVEVEAREIRKKPTRGQAYLAAEICLTSEQWANRIELSAM